MRYLLHAESHHGARKDLRYFSGPSRASAWRAYSHPQAHRFRGSPLFLPAPSPSSLREASLAERMSRASGRRTTRSEDVAYCMLGILGIPMPLLYGEGDAAFMRLQEELVRQSDDQTILAWDIALDSGDPSTQDTGPKHYARGRE